MTHDLLTPATGEAPTAVARFMDWLREEAAVFDEETRSAHSTRPPSPPDHTQ